MAGLTIVCVLTEGSFQYLSAFEALAQLSDGQDRLHLYANQRAQDCAELLEMPWVQTEFFARPPACSRAQSLSIARRIARRCVNFIDSCGDVDMLVLGNFGDLFHVAANACLPGRTVVLDEGLGTPRSYQRRMNRLSDKRPQSFVKRLLKDAALGGRTAPVASVTAFTVFNCVRTLPADEKVVHRFECLRGRRVGELGDHSLVIGSPVVQLGMVDARCYGALLHRLHQQIPHPTVYRPHLIEQQDDVSYVPAAWRIGPSRAPVESELLRGPIPREIVGLASTALVSAELLVGDVADVRRFSISADLASRSGSERIAECDHLLDGFPIRRLAQF